MLKDVKVDKELMELDKKHCIHPTSSIEEVAENTGFPIKYIELKTTPLPTERELQLLKEIDPADLRNMEFGL